MTLHEVRVGGCSAERDRSCPIWRVEVERTQVIDYFVAAETAELAQEAADHVAHREVDDWGYADLDVVVSHQPVWQLSRAESEQLGIWVRTGARKGTWVWDEVDVPRVARPPDPNQLRLIDLTELQSGPSLPKARQIEDVETKGRV